jgi:hypothetical protein
VEVQDSSPNREDIYETAGRGIYAYYKNDETKERTGSPGDP